MDANRSGLAPGRQGSQKRCGPLRSGDIVVVPMSGIAKLGVFVQQYLRDSNPMYGTYNITLGSASGAFAAPIP